MSERRSGMTSCVEVPSAKLILRSCCTWRWVRARNRFLSMMAAGIATPCMATGWIAGCAMATVMVVGSAVLLGPEVVEGLEARGVLRDEVGVGHEREHGVGHEGRAGH